METVKEVLRFDVLQAVWAVRDAMARLANDYIRPGEPGHGEYFEDDLPYSVATTDMERCLQLERCPNCGFVSTHESAAAVFGATPKTPGVWRNPAGPEVVFVSALGYQGAPLCGCCHYTLDERAFE